MSGGIPGGGTGAGAGATCDMTGLAAPGWHRRAHTSLLRTLAGGTGSARASSPGSEEEAGSEVLSHCSSAGESASPADEGPGEPRGPHGDPHVGRGVPRPRAPRLHVVPLGQGAKRRVSKARRRR